MSPTGAAGAGLDIVEVTTKAQLNTFIEVPWRVYRDDATWTPPLKFERRGLFDRKKNPYFEHAEAAYWVAYKNGEAVGRISAQVDQMAQTHQGAGTGHFGSIEAIDDPDVFSALFDTAETWLRDRGMTRVLGPFTLSINEETGLLVDGFEHPPRILMSHARPYYLDQILRLGFEQAQEMWAYDLDVTKEFPDNVQKILTRARALEKLTLRKFDKKKFKDELYTVIGIFNDAWSDNWGFIPMTAKEIDKMGDDLKPFVAEEGCMIAYWDGEPTAFMLTIPDINQAVADLDGRVFPLGWVKLLSRLILGTPTRCRVPLMGVKKEHQSGLAGASMAMLLIETIRANTVKTTGYKRAELSWILESNPSMHKILKLIGCEHYKTYRVYEKAL